MRTSTRSVVQALGLLAVVGLLLALVACGTKEKAAVPTTIKISMLIQSSEQDARWFRNVEVAKGTDAYELTEKVTQGGLRSTYYALYRSHFVDSILGVENKNPKFWLTYVWSEPEKKWEPLPVGADLYSLKDGHILAWYYADTTNEKALPTAAP
ncbi:MAG: DUF4430 domain-containing protein [Dehalococcoidia bacterium]|nr:DUF4430 domain-containing protein [Dehalococcoidia bacterium]